MTPGAAVLIAGPALRALIRYQDLHFTGLVISKEGLSRVSSSPTKVLELLTTEG